MSNPLVSVIIPTYKRSEFLCTTINSVLAQTYKNIEIIVVDDNGIGTTYQQETEKKLQSYIKKNQIIYLCHKENKNGSAARNTGLRLSHGEYINFLDDDDELMPAKIESQVKRLQGKDESVGATYCNSKNIRIKSIINKLVVSETHYEQEGNILLDFLLNKCCFGTSSLMFRKDVLLKLRGFDESYYRHQDVELMTRFFLHGYNVACTSTFPLLVYDMSKDRQNVTSCIKDFNIKDKFLSQFAFNFERLGIKKLIEHHFWFLCAANAIRHKDYKIYLQASKKMKGTGPFTVHEYYILTRRFISSIFS